MLFNPILTTDSYKLGHPGDYPNLTEFVQSNLTARGSRNPDIKGTVFIGGQPWYSDFLIDKFSKHFFELKKEDVLEEYERRLFNLLGPNTIGTDHIAALHDLGYLPVKIKAVPEGTIVPLRVPMLIIENTLPEFYWVTNFLETALSNAMWMPITSATNAHYFYQMLMKFANETGDPEFVKFQGHDFSMRGMSSIEAAAMSGVGHLASFVGSDTLVATEVLEQYYGAKDYEGMVAVSVAATEHSVMCAGGNLEGQELATYRYLLMKHAGILSVVSDTWDYWHVLTVILVELKELILSRTEGKLVIRPDSGNPIDIICGDPNAPEGSPAHRGTLNILWDIFGGTVNEKGYKVLNDRIGIIYGDGINYEVALAILTRMKEMGFATTNIVLGMGSFWYQYVTRDTFMMAVKATWCQINGEPHDIFKDPITDNGVKKSAIGRLAVLRDEKGELYVVNQATPEQEAQCIMETVFLDGQLHNQTTLTQIRERLATAA